MSSFMSEPELTEEQRLNLIVSSVTDYAIYMLDAGGIITTWNPGAERFKGYRREEVLGRHFSLFYTEEDKATDLPRRALSLAEHEGRFEQEGWRVRKDGTRMWAHVVIDPIRDRFGRIIGYAKLTRDITDRRRAQEELEEARQKLVQAQKMEMIGQLTGGVAHDFNNLLAVVLGNLDLLRKGAQDARSSRLIENAIAAAQRGASLTQRMLAFARRQDLKVETIEIPELVRGMAEMMERAIGPTIEIHTGFPLLLPPVSADPNQLELALLNLVVNARDAMSGNGRIAIAADRVTLGADDGELAAGDYVRVSVSDTGSGMDEETLSRAVDPFFTTKGVGKGTGLGLSMVHGFATQSGGSLKLHSAPGQGTQAEIWLPVARRAAVTPAVGDTTPAPRQHQLRILVVDDDHLVLTNTAMMLEDLGHRVLEASSGDQALRILRRDAAIEMLITDQVMPGMSGTELIALARQEFPMLAIMLATGFADPADTTPDNVLRLSKPFLQEDLARAIGTAGERQPGPQKVVALRNR